MKVSIITPVFNDPRVVRALESVLSQQFEGELELIVIDGGSTDGTLSLLEAFRPHLAKLVTERDDGIYHAMNKGIRLATGDIVGILNADDRYQDSSVFRDVIAAFNDPAIGACYGDLVYVDQDDQVQRYWRSGRFRKWKFYTGWMAPHPTFFVRRDVYRRFGDFKVDLRVSADYEFILRVLLKHRVPVAYIPRVLVRMATGGNSNKSIRNVMRGNREVSRSWELNGLRFGHLVPYAKPFSKLWQFVHRPQSA